MTSSKSDGNATFVSVPSRSRAERRVELHGQGHLEYRKKRTRRAVRGDEPLRIQSAARHDSSVEARFARRVEEM
jgi:hypothetical protein